MIPKVIFYVNFEKDLEYFKSDYSLLKKIGFNLPRLLKKYYPDCLVSNKEKIIEYFVENKDKFLRKINEKKIKRKWNSINDKFFIGVEKLTGFKWKFNTYKCLLSITYVVGGRYALPNEIVVFYAQPKLLQTIGHELFHLHFLSIFESFDIKLTERNITKLWDLAEVVTELTLSELNINNINFSLGIYPQHKRLYKKLKTLWITKSSFKEFLGNILPLKSI